MSAFVVDPAQIDLILSVAVNGPSDRRGPHDWHAPWAVELTGHEGRLTRKLASRAGAAMLAENIASVKSLYRDSDFDLLPGPAPTPDPDQYEWTEFGAALTIVEALKAIESYEYQSNEHPDWSGSGSAAFCNRLRATLVSYLPGYEEAPWTWTVEAALARAPRPFNPEQMR